MIERFQLFNIYFYLSMADYFYNYSLVEFATLNVSSVIFQIICIGTGKTQGFKRSLKEIKIYKKTCEALGIWPKEKSTD